MPYIFMSPAAKKAIRDYAKELAPYAPWNKDENEVGEVWMDEATIERVEKLSFPDEDFSDTLTRLLAISNNGSN